MRRSREANPALATQRDAKCGVTSQVPGNRVSTNFQRSSAGIIFNLIVADSKIKWISPSGAQFEIRQRKSLNEALWFSILRKPCSPKLERHSSRVFGTTPSPRIHQQVSKPPGTAAIREAQANEPDFIPAASRQRGEYFVQSLNGFNRVTVHSRRFKTTNHTDESYSSRVKSLRERLGAQPPHRKPEKQNENCSALRFA